MILHIDMDAFFASIEQAVNPRLKNKPLIVGSRNNKMHTVVCAASYEAKALGIDSGMPTKEAFALCPHLEFVPADQTKYIWTSEQIFGVIKESGFTAFYSSIDEFQLDIKEAADPAGIASRIREDINRSFGITASIGIAKNCLLAKLASKLRKPDGLFLIDEDNIKKALAETPAARLCDIGPRTQEALSALGVKTCLDLYSQTPQLLERVFGANGLNLYAGLHSNETLPEDNHADNRPKSIGHSYSFPRASENTGFINAWIRLLSEMVARRLRAHDLTARTVHLWLNGPQIGGFSAQKTFQEPSQDASELYARTLRIMAKIGQKHPKIRALGVTASSLETPKYPALFREAKRREELIRSLDKINGRFGEDTIFPSQIMLTRKIR